MNRIVKAHYPVEKLPEDLRKGLPQRGEVTVTLEVEETSATRGTISLDAIFDALPQDLRKDGDQIDEDIRLSRDQWERKGE